ncbi:flagellar basal body-associated FliL family protein [Desulfovibrio desulfuricans]|uniref:Flagellar protein FliL n=1 Tax=Desulfovibrio desulfuricans TaxID=876 RepID=A0A4P7UJD8_DESDE|nr:flagellar basal body-associated FliL family protein [Desulfovibrio desulfuricans]QCC86575.1 flagellar basal body-associated FliL family protein [Desulfovibrio desulfuricans]
MAEKQETKEAPAKDELQVAVSPDTSLRKVELDLDDAPFLQEQESPPPAKTDKAPLQVPAEAPAPSKKKKLLIAGAAALLVVLVAAVAVWWFVLRTPPPPPQDPVKPEVIVVPSAKSPTAKPDSVKELAPFVIPRQTAKGARFLICKFSTVSQSPRVGMEIDQKLIPLRDALYYYLSSKSDAFLLDPASVPTIKKDLGGVLNDYLTQGRIDDILFESYLNE